MDTSNYTWVVLGFILSLPLTLASSKKKRIVQQWSYGRNVIVENFSRQGNIHGTYTPTTDTSCLFFYNSSVEQKEDKMFCLVFSAKRTIVARSPTCSQEQSSLFVILMRGSVKNNLNSPSPPFEMVASAVYTAPSVFIFFPFSMWLLCLSSNQHSTGAGTNYQQLFGLFA